MGRQGISCPVCRAVIIGRGIEDTKRRFSKLSLLPMKTGCQLLLIARGGAGSLPVRLHAQKRRRRAPGEVPLRDP
jgi:hypothetical protein